MRIRNINFNILGYASASILGLMTLALLLPTVDSSVHATEYCKGDNGYVECDASGTVATYAHVASVVSLGVQSNVVMDVVPKSTGVVTQTPVSLRVSTNSPEGYSLYMKTMGETNALTNMSGDDSQIDPIEGQVPASNLSSQSNVWGYAIGSSEEKTYQAVPTSQSQAVYTTDHLVLDNGDDIVNLSFASNITTSLPAGTYHNSVLISAVANPVTITNLSELTFMQDMTPEICTNTPDYVDINSYSTKQLIDTRDGKKYWVAKLKDGKCWMTQNLALNLGTAPDAETEAKLGKFVSKLTPSDSDVSADWMPSVSTGYGIPETQSTKDNTKGSWNLGQIVLKQPLQSIYCDPAGDNKNIVANTGENITEVCSELFQDVSSWQAYSVNPSPQVYDTASQMYDAHYLIGNYYKFEDVTADTAVGLVGSKPNGNPNNLKNASGSICPKGWRLVKTGFDLNDSGKLTGQPFDINGSIYGLLSKYGYTNWNSNGGSTVNMAELSFLANPLYFTLSGSIAENQGALYSAGYSGIMWTSTLVPTTWNAYHTVFEQNAVIIINASGRAQSLTARCVARQKF